MKTSNWIVYALAVVVSAFLLWLWFFLGFNKIDSPLDLVLSIVWWAVVVIAVIGIFYIEAVRKRHIRTLYVGESTIFNSEKGAVQYQGPEQMMASMTNILDTLKYNFDKQDLPSQERTPMCYVIRTNEYKDNVWKGEVCIAGEDVSHTFASKQELSKLMNNLR